MEHINPLRMRNFQLQSNQQHAADPRKEEFRGIITSTSMNDRSFRMNKQVIAELARQANGTNIKVLRRHDAWGDPVGHSLAAVLQGDKVVADFVIGRGLKNPDTDDLILKMELAIYDSLSTGTAGGKMVCDKCQGEMKLKMLGWFSAGFVCNNDHILGSKSENTRVTAELQMSTEDPIRLLEYSVCPVGANKDAKILQEINKLMLSGEIDNHQLADLCELNDLSYNDFRLELAANPAPLQFPVNINLSDLKNRGDENMFEKLDEHLSLDLSALEGNPEYQELAAAIQTRLEGAKKYVHDEFNAYANSETAHTELEKAKAQILELEEAAEKNATLIKIGEKRMDELRLSGRAALRDWFGENYALDPEGKSKLAEINDTTLSYDALKGKVDAAWSVARTLRPKGKRSTTPTSLGDPKEGKNFKFRRANGHIGA